MLNPPSPIDSHTPSPPLPLSSSKARSLGFVLLIIVGIGGLAVASAGVCAYFHVGHLSQLSQIQAVILMSAGGGGGLLFIIAGAVGRSQTVRSRTLTSPRSSTGKQEVAAPAVNATSPRVVAPQELHPHVFGLQKWEERGVKIMEEVPPIPSVEDLAKENPFLSGRDEILDFSKCKNRSLAETTVLIYIPEKIIVNDQPAPFTIEEAQLHMKSEKSGTGDVELLEKIGKFPVESGWTLMTRFAIPGSENLTVEEQKNMLEKTGYRLPTVGEALVLLRMLYPVKSPRPLTPYSTCSDCHGEENLQVGMNSRGLCYPSYYDPSDMYSGIFAVRKYDSLSKQWTPAKDS